jgi:8-oxo-dGTP pyrophosphatase MutT (NUDIX family)
MIFRGILFFFSSVVWMKAARRRNKPLIYDGRLCRSYPCVVKEENLDNASSKWVRMKLLHYFDDFGILRMWESFERKTRSVENFCDGMLIIAQLVGGIHDSSIVYVTQFRPAVGKKTLELPAGLVDPGESPEATALRELHEETGLFGEIVSISPLMYIDVGLSNERVAIARVRVDMNREINKFPKQHTEAGESIEVVYLKAPTRLHLEQYCLERDLAIDINLFHSLIA